MTNIESAEPGAGLRAETRSPAPVKGRRATRTTGLILQAARRVFRERGYASASIEAIAETAGIGRASVYTYFRSKRDILITLGTAGNEQLQATIRAFPDTVDHGSVAAWAGSFLDMVENDQNLAFTWTEAARTDEALRAESIQQYTHAWTTLADRIDRATGAELTAVDGMLLVATFERVVAYWQDLHAPVSRDELVEHVTSLILALVDRRARAS